MVKKLLRNKDKTCYSFDYKSIARPAELQGHLEKAYIYSRIESQDSFRLFFYAYFLAKLVFKYFCMGSLPTRVFYIFYIPMSNLLD